MHAESLGENLKIKILGCSGGIGGSRRTTSMLVNDNILIDCGTGVMDLELDALAKIEHLFLTHTHLDHLASLPLMLDSVQEQFAARPLTIHLTAESDQVIRQDLFNWRLWPDFFNLGDDSPVCMQTRIMTLNDFREIGDIRFSMLPARHSVPAVGYLMSGENTGSFAFSGDCSENDELWRALNALPALDQLVVECSYTAAEEELSRKAKHIFISHLKAGNEDLIMQQLADLIPQRRISRLHNGQSFTL